MGGSAKSNRSIRTLEQARKFVREVGICGIFSDGKGGLVSLWDVVDLPEKQPGQKGWGERVSAIWRWKNELPATHPDEVFYGKIPGGLAVLMSLDYLWNEHYPRFHREIEECSPIARRMYGVIRVELLPTTALRNQLGMTHPPAKGKFEKALVELQTTLNVVRSNDPAATNDVWVPFREQYTVPGGN